MITISHSDSKFPIAERSTVTLHLSLSLEDGTVAESTFGGEPLTFTLGDGTLDYGLELGLYGLVSGAKQRLTLDPGQAFGQRDPGRVHTLPRETFAADMQLEPGMIIGFETEAGEELPGAVLEVDKETVQVDFNHPLAGRTILYEVEILDVVPAEVEE
ncbi:MAG: FKBP-type peptidyl-prolyl cis-trans isomerase [Gammaproteobacteria bacterium]